MMDDFKDPPHGRTFPLEWHLTPAGDRVLAQLARKGQASKKVIAYLACPRGMGSVAAVKAHVSQLRAALAARKISLTINNIRGWGYQIDRRGKTFLADFLPDDEEREAA